MAAEDGAAAALAEDLADDAATVVRLDRPGWATALAAAGADQPLAVVVTAATDEVALPEVLADGTLGTVVLPPGGAAAATAAAALLRLPEGSVRTDDATGAVLVDVTAPHAPVAPATLAALLGVARVVTATGAPATTAPIAPWRVAAVGAAATAWRGAALRAAPVPGTHAADDPAGHVDLLLVGTDADPGVRERATVAARAAGAVVAGVPGVDGVVPDDVDVALGDAADGPDAVRPLPTAVVGQDGWQRDPAPTWGLVTWSDGEHDAAAAARELAGGDPTTLGLRGDVALDPGDVGTVAAVLGGLRGVLDLPSLHRAPTEHAHRLATWALAGVPVLLADLPSDVRRLLGDELADVLAGARRDELADPDARERRTVLARRAAWRAHGPSARWGALAGRLVLPAPAPTTVSVVLATNRPDFLAHGVEQVLAQTWPATELVLALHGSAFTADDEAAVVGRVGATLPLTVLRVPDDATLGDALNAAARAASGTWLTKMDDDDWYSPDHLVDLLLAAEHTGADLLGKAAEFVHLAEAGVTLRRFGRGQHTGSTTLAGGTLTLRRDVWRDVGGFARVSLGEDRVLVADVGAAGGRIHRTTGFGYLLHRHGRHAWEVDAQYFRDQAVAERPGLARDWSLTAAPGADAAPPAATPRQVHA